MKYMVEFVQYGYAEVEAPNKSEALTRFNNDDYNPDKVETKYIIAKGVQKARIA